MDVRVVWKECTHKQDQEEVSDDKKAYCKSCAKHGRLVQGLSL